MNTTYRIVKEQSDGKKALRVYGTLGGRTQSILVTSLGQSTREYQSRVIEKVKEVIDTQLRRDT